MKAHDKVLLLAEFFDADVKSSIESILHAIEESESYRILLENVERAKKYKVPYTEELLKSYDEMKFSTISTIRDALVAKATIDHLSYISSPRYFINPITYNAEEMKSDLEFIGQLPCYIKGDEVTFDFLIESENYVLKEKMKTIDIAITKWHQEAKEIIVDPINILMKKNEKTYKKDYRLPAHIWSNIILIILFNMFFALTLMSQEWIFVGLRALGIIKVSTVIYLIFVSFLFLYEAWEMINFFTFNKNKTEKHQCYSYLRNHSKHAYKSLEEATFKLRMLLLDGLKEKKLKKTSLKKYNYLNHFRRIILFLKIKEQPVSTTKSKNYIYYVKVTVLVLFILSFVALTTIIILSLAKGEMI